METYLAIGAGLAIGMAALGCGLGQGVATYGAVQGTSRNPSAASKIGGQLVLGLALIESVAIYGLVIGFLLLSKIG